MYDKKGHFRIQFARENIWRWITAEMCFGVLSVRTPYTVQHLSMRNGKPVNQNGQYVDEFGNVVEGDVPETEDPEEWTNVGLAVVPDEETCRCTPFGYGAGIDTNTVHLRQEASQAKTINHIIVPPEIESRLVCNAKFCCQEELIDPVGSRTRS